MIRTIVLPFAAVLIASSLAGQVQIASIVPASAPVSGGTSP